MSSSLKRGARGLKIKSKAGGGMIFKKNAHHDYPLSRDDINI